MTPEQELTHGEASQVGARAERHRRLARLFALAATTTSPWEQAGILARIRKLLAQEGPSDAS
jgi:hypothetical protein